MQCLSSEQQRSVIKTAEILAVKKLGPWQTYFSLLKGFVAIGFLWMPKNCLNGGWAFSLFAVALSFTVTYYSLQKLLQAREQVTGGQSYSDIAFAALGLPGKYILDSFLSIMLYGFVIAEAYFTIINLKNVADSIFGTPVPEFYLGKQCLSSHCAGIFVFLVTTPLIFVRRIEKLAFTYVIADFLILITAITILVYAVLHI